MPGRRGEVGDRIAHSVVAADAVASGGARERVVAPYVVVSTAEWIWPGALVHRDSEAAPEKHVHLGNGECVTARRIGRA